MVAEVEQIPDSDDLSRHIDFPHKYRSDEDLIWPNVFEFPNGNKESLVWRKYKPTIEEVHGLGCEREAAKKASKPEWSYKGAITTTAGSIRSIKSKRGHGFKVAHEPIEGIYHAEIERANDPDAPFNKNDKNELRDMLKSAFGPLEPYSCGGA